MHHSVHAILITSLFFTYIKRVSTTNQHMACLTPPNPLILVTHNNLVGRS
jgi:hypothetical protein